jgi:hypothetical protein
MASMSLPLNAADYSRFEIFTGYSFLGADMSLSPGNNSYQQYYYDEAMFASIPFYHTLTNPSDMERYSGFDISGTYNINKWLGIDVGFQRQSGRQVISHAVQYLGYQNQGSKIMTISEVPVVLGDGGPIAPLKYESEYASESTTTAIGFGTADYTHDSILIGPRFSLRTKSRFTPYGHIQIGVSRIKSNDFQLKYSVNRDYREYDSSTNDLNSRVTNSSQGKLTGDHKNVGFVMSLGGGIDWKINKWMSLRLIQADYLMERYGRNYKYSDNYSADVSNYTYAIVSELVDYDTFGNPYYANYLKETKQTTVNNGTRKFSYSVPRQSMNHLKLSAGIVFRF